MDRYHRKKLIPALILALLLMPVTLALAEGSRDIPRAAPPAAPKLQSGGTLFLGDSHNFTINLTDNGIWSGSGNVIANTCPYGADRVGFIMSDSWGFALLPGGSTAPYVLKMENYGGGEYNTEFSATSGSDSAMWVKSGGIGEYSSSEICNEFGYSGSKCLTASGNVNNRSGDVTSVMLTHYWMYHQVGAHNGTLQDVCYGENPTPTPTPYCENVVGTWKSVDIMATGTLQSGKYTADQAIIDGNNYYVIDFSIVAPIPQTLDGYNSATLSIGVDYRGLIDPNLTASYTATVNGETYVGEDGGSIPIALPGTTSLAIDYHAVIPGSPSQIDTMEVVMVAARVASYPDPGKNLLCDGGMEQYPGSSWWSLASPGDFGRINRAFQSGAANAINGLAACSSGQQVLGTYYMDGGELWYSGTPIKQPFHWDGGTAEWKVRLRGGLGIGGSARAWIMDNAGSEIAVLYSGSVSGSWTLHTGAVDLDESDYWFVIDANSSSLQSIYYDDVAIGSEIDTECQEDMDQIPTEVTRTPTSTGQPTPTNTATIDKTTNPTRTVTATLQASVTSTITTTARPTRTATITAEVSSTPGPTTTITRTPYGTPYNGTVTVDPNATGTPQPGGDYPPDGNNPSMGDCNKPVNQWSLAWWLDYEVCRVLYAFSWQPGHSATLVAIPAAANNYEPFASARRIGDGVNSVQTAVATAIIGNDAFVSHSTLTPNPNMFKAPANSPWNGAPFTVPNMDPRKQTTSQFSTVCNHRMLTVIGSTMAPGFCFALNMIRDLGLLIWFQVLLDILAVMSLVRSIFVTLKFYPLLYETEKGKE